MKTTIYTEANFIIDYWKENGFNESKAIQCSILTCQLIMIKQPENIIYWKPIYNYLINKYETKKKNFEITETN